MMELDAMIASAVSTFKHKIYDRCKDFDTQALTPLLAAQVTDALKEALSCAGVSAFSTFLEGYETDASTLLVDGRMHRFKKTSDKRFITPFGAMRLSRNVYQADCGGPCYVPLDEQWGMAGQFATLEVREAVLYASAHITPCETVDLLDKCALFSLSSTAVKNIIQETGDFIEEEATSINEAIREKEAIPETSQAFVVSLDGVTVRMDSPGIKRGPAPMRPDKAAETTTTCFKQAMVASLSFYGTPEEQTDGPVRLGSKYITRMPEKRAPTFKQHFEQELCHIETCLPNGVQKVLLIDGAKGLWRYAKTHPTLQGYDCLIDFYHTVEHLSMICEYLFGKNSKKAKAFYERWYHKLLEDPKAPEAIIRAIDRCKKERPLSASLTKKLAQDRTFFCRNKGRMSYPDFLKRGLPIGSGPVEAACKSLVKTRLCRSGMYWSWQGGQRILQLRTYVKSARWEAFWHEYKIRHTSVREHQVLQAA